MGAELAGSTLTREEASMATPRIPALLAGLLTALLLAGSAAALEVGQKAPDFTLPGPGGKQVKLSELTAKGPVVLYTFIQAFTPT
jgi:peroxiredoxin Q/BCP